MFNNSSSFDQFMDVCGELDFAAAEAYRLLRAEVQHSLADHEDCKIIGVASAEKYEGKTALAVNLAYMLACDKQKALLLEGDMRVPSIAKMLDLKSSPGLSEYLSGRTKINKVIQHSELAPTLPVICAGTVSEDSSELLDSEGMNKLFAALKEYVDYIIVDLPPINAVSDSLSVARYVNGYIVAVRGEYARKRNLKNAVRKLQLVNANILGFVVNDAGGASKRGGGKHKNYGETVSK